MPRSSSCRLETPWRRKESSKKIETVMEMKQIRADQRRSGAAAAVTTAAAVAN